LDPQQEDDEFYAPPTSSQHQINFALGQSL